jgi:hypothetical protein
MIGWEVLEILFPFDLELKRIWFILTSWKKSAQEICSVDLWGYICEHALAMGNEAYVTSLPGRHKWGLKRIRGRIQ